MLYNDTIARFARMRFIRAQGSQYLVMLQVTRNARRPSTRPLYSVPCSEFPVFALRVVVDARDDFDESTATLRAFVRAKFPCWRRSISTGIIISYSAATGDEGAIE